MADHNEARVKAVRDVIAANDYCAEFMRDDLDSLSEDIECQVEAGADDYEREVYDACGTFQHESFEDLRTLIAQALRTYDETTDEQRAMQRRADA